jgi:RNA polymerase sigma-70 factor, ECF subfamily
LRTELVGNNPGSPGVFIYVAKLLNESLSDRRLVERLRARDASAVDDLASRYSPRIRQLAIRYVRNEEDAKEVVQDVLLKVYQKIGAFRGDSSLSSWIYRITFNTAMSRLRAAKPNWRDADLHPFEPAGGDGARTPDIADWSSLGDDEALRGELRRRLVKALAGLPRIYRAPVLLRDVRGLTTEEASAALKVKDETLKSRLHRGRMILREQLADFADGLALRRASVESRN